MRNVIASAVLWVTWLLAPVGIVALLVRRRFRTAFGFLGAFAAVIAFNYVVLQVPDRHLRIWLVMPSAILLGVLGFSGIWICGAAWSALHGERPEPIEEDILGSIRGPWVTRRRVTASAIMASAVAAWFFGATHPRLGDYQFIFMIYSFAGFAIGAYLFVQPGHAKRT